MATTDMQSKQRFIERALRDVAEAGHRGSDADLFAAYATLLSVQRDIEAELLAVEQHAERREVDLWPDGLDTHRR